MKHTVSARPTERPLSTAAAEENFLQYILGAEMKTADNAELDAVLKDSRAAPV